MITKLIVGDDIKVHDYIVKLQAMVLDFTKWGNTASILYYLEKDVLEVFNKLYIRNEETVVDRISVAEQNVVYLLDNVYSGIIVVNNVELGMNPAKHQQWVQLFMDFCESKGVTTLYMTTCSDHICAMFDEDDIIRL